METKSYVVWASGSEAQKTAPSATLIEKGWVAEQPAYEHFNWLFNRIDTRLSTLEQPRTSSTQCSPSRVDTIHAGDFYTVPPYMKGNGSLEVYIGGVLAYNIGTGGRDLSECQYVEQDPLNGNTASTTIVFTQDIPPYLSIDVKAWTTPTNEVPTDLRYGVTSYNVLYEGQVITLTGETQNTAIISTIKNFTLRVEPLTSGYIKRILVLFRNEKEDNASSHTVYLEGVEDTKDIMLSYGRSALYELYFINNKAYMYKLSTGEL